MPRSSEGNWPKVAIGGLILLNLVLFVLLALRNPTATVTAQPVTPGATAGSLASRSPEEEPTTPAPRAEPSSRSASPVGPSPTASPSPKDSPSPTASDPATGRSTRLLAVSSGTTAWRTAFAACPDGSAVEVSRDGGRTWRSVEPGLKSVSRLRAYGPSSVFAVGAGADCRTRYAATGRPGESWSTNERLLGQTWYRVPRQPNRVHAPAGRVSEPCDGALADFAGLGDLGAAALCADGSVRTTQDRGGTWKNLGGTATVLSIGADEQAYAVAMRRDGCDGVAVTLLSAGADDIDEGDVRCASVGSSASSNAALGVRGQTLWLWLDDEVSVSTDGGRTWGS